MEEQERCLSEGGVWKQDNCRFDGYSPFRKGIYERSHELKQTFKDANEISQVIITKSKSFTIGYKHKEILPRWIITFIVLAVFTIVFIAPITGVLFSFFAAFAVKLILDIWAMKEQSIDKIMNIILYALFFIGWIISTQLSFVNVSWSILLLSGLIIDFSLAIGIYLKQWINNKYVFYVSELAGFLIVYYIIGGYPGMIISAIAGLIAMIVIIPSYVPCPPYVLPVMTLLLLALKVVADYISQFLGAIF